MQLFHLLLGLGDLGPHERRGLHAPGGDLGVFDLAGCHGENFIPVNARHLFKLIGDMAHLFKGLGVENIALFHRHHHDQKIGAAEGFPKFIMYFYVFMILRQQLIEVGGDGELAHLPAEGKRNSADDAQHQQAMPDDKIGKFFHYFIHDSPFAF